MVDQLLKWYDSYIEVNLNLTFYLWTLKCLPCPSWLVEEWNMLELSLPYFSCSNTRGLFGKFWKIKHRLAPQMILWYRLLCLIPHRDLLCLLFAYPTSNMLVCGVIGKRIEGILTSHILLSQKPDLKKIQATILDQVVHVCGYFLCFLWTLSLRSSIFLHF